MTRMKDLDRGDLPREKFAKHGPGKLADHELLALLLGSGVRGANVLALSRAILKKVAEKGADRVTAEDLSGIRGLGPAKAAQTLAAIALGKRLADGAHAEIGGPQDVWNLCADFRGSKREHFAACYLDARNRLLERHIVSVGILDASLVHPREVFEPALRLSAASVVVAHNHPSGDVSPSDADLALTKRLAAAGDLLGIPLLDHIVVTKDGHVSIR